ncbi:hypothetical protein CSPB_0172 [Campylobacter sputorum subsp. bovis]|nr:hypothetical protein CSPB_0172 [Campylobacter sputorum]
MINSFSLIDESFCTEYKDDVQKQQTRTHAPVRIVYIEFEKKLKAKIFLFLMFLI